MENLTTLIIDKNKLLYVQEREAVKLYKQGLSLGQICRKIHLDVSSVLDLLRKNKLKKKTLYKIFQKQTIELESKHNTELILEEDKHFIDKFFLSSEFTSSYYWFWKKYHEKTEEKRRNCKHEIRHIQCAYCSKILKDASDIPLIDDSELIIDTEEETENKILHNDQNVV